MHHKDIKFRLRSSTRQRLPARVVQPGEGEFLGPQATWTSPCSRQFPWQYGTRHRSSDLSEHGVCRSSNFHSGHNHADGQDSRAHDTLLNLASDLNTGKHSGMPNKRTRSMSIDERFLRIQIELDPL